MAVKRKGVSASLRWQVFARDGYRCRYCGVQAGEPGVTLHADHVVSVADGGTNAMDNLVAACQRCNGGKGARSALNAPGSEEAIAFATHSAATLREQADAIAAAKEAKEAVRQEAINLVCDAYGVKTFKMCDVNVAQLIGIINEHGPVLVADWIERSAARRIPTTHLVRYLYGIIRRMRNEANSESA